jgi:outer membrane lipase/esterase
MKMSKRILPSVLASLFLGAAATGAQAQQFSSVVVFGDSLSDAGFFRPVLGAAGVPASLLPTLGRFTTAPGPVWSELVTQYYGFTSNPSNLSSGNIFAQGGARVAVNSSSTPAGAAQRPVSTQIGEYLARGGGAADPNGLYFVWGGANDVIQTILGAGAGVIPADQVSTIIQGAAVAEVQQIGRLKAAGAQYIVVFGLPNIGATPGFIAAGATASAGATQGSAGFNTALFTGLGSAGLRVIPVDAFTFLAEIRANPSSFGFTNITTPACGAFPPFSSSSDALFCPPNVWAAADANQRYLFADGIHPTTAAHALIAQFVESMIDAPKEYSLLAEVPLSTRNGHVRSLNEGLAQGGRVDVGSYTIFAAGDRGDFDVDSGTAFGGVKSTNTSATVGFTGRASEEVTLGAAFGMSKNDAAFGGSGGGFRTTERIGSAFVSVKWRGFYGTAVGSVGNIRFSNVSRNIVLGPLTRTASARSDGSNMSAALNAGYDLQLGRFSIGPLVGVTTQNVTVNAFDESNASSSNLHIAEQSRKSEVWSAGVRASIDIGSWTPWLRVTADKERRDNVRLVTASPLSLASGNSYDLPAYAPDTDFVTGSVGIRGTIAQSVGVSLAYTKVTSRSGIKEDGVSAMLSMRF